MNGQTRTHVLGFRISELKSVLNQLSLSTSGRKAELQGRIFQYFGEPFRGTPSNPQAPKEEWRLQAASRSPYMILATTEELFRYLGATGLPCW